MNHLRSLFTAGIAFALLACAHTQPAATAPKPTPIRQVQAAAVSVKTWLASPSGQQALSFVSAAEQSAVAFSPAAATDLSVANIAIRSLESGTAPSAADIATQLAAFKVSPTTASAISAPVANAVANAVHLGIAPSSATEAVVAKGLDPGLVAVAAR